ncbi:uncharacterized protein DUF3800 [Rhodobacter aestuarii]|uniref:DUF3800 domain-containing protein n=1 Tax=Rhodobacter aestuarii TaxID=453582 RepID=A0A1N7QFD4_9RHOB|nr:MULTISPECIES: DUF3800 domain-containing protein [Rhodobacter]PTV93503.1 uncharacterized protein DUF3800 [Rhodobacter aestuarii]SIT21469.1 Protein of unknown function [Rhodobacter aestuarii]SOC08515.1 uncharacterized protein DUF3800 [Rhodobacter sp. JA431]
MHLCFIDESGTPPSRPNPDRPYFTLGAVIIRDADWRGIANDVRGFCTSNALRGELKWRYFSPHNSSAENPMLGKNAAERKALSQTFAHIIARSPLTIIACVTDIGAAFEYASVTDQQELYHFAYKPLSERFQYFLQDHKSLGVTIADHRGRDNDRLFRAHHDNLTSGTGSTVSGYDRFIEGLFLQDSCHSIGIQLADFVAGAIHRAYSTKDGELAAILKPRIRRKPDGSIQGHGIVHHPRDRFRNDLVRR